MAAPRSSRRPLVRFVVPFLATLVLMVSLLTLSISTSLYQLEQQNPVALMLDQSYFRQQQEEDFITQVTYPIEDSIPNPPLDDGYNTFSACMLVMDDNHRLAEWLAYHYHVLPLRTLVVAVDPRSKTSPTFILNRWRRQGMYIEEWGDRDFWRADLELKPIPDQADLQVKRDRHRGRQKYFYRRCMIHMRNINRTWVSLHDTDEYIVYNHAGGDHYQMWEDRMQKRHDRSLLHGDKIRVKPSQIPPPTTAQAGQLIHYIRHEQKAGLQYYQSPCIGIPRLQFGADESTTLQQQKDVPNDIIDATRFDTLRWRKHAPRNDFVKNALGKVIMDVSRIDVAASPIFMSLHRPIKTICAAPWHNDWESGLRINHYLGSWESYSFRDDSRRGGERSREQWEYKATTNGDDTDDNVRPWITGFVQQHGPKKTQELLQDVGLPKNYRIVNESQWKLKSDRLQEILSTNVTIANDNKMVAFDAWVREKYRNNNNKSIQSS